MAAKGKAHETWKRNLLRELPKLIGERVTLQSQAPITIPPNSEPEPNFAIVQNRMVAVVGGAERNYQKNS